ncbi:MAG: diguanylate cyclase, partial [Acidobacteriota bacterium]
GIGLFSDRTLTVSIGVASYPHDGSDAEQILSEADRRMYQEKHANKEARNTKPHKDWAKQLAAVQQEPAATAFSLNTH